MPIYEASERVLRAFQDELMPAESLSEIFDVVGQYTNNTEWLWALSPCTRLSSSQVVIFWTCFLGLLSEIPDPDLFLQDLLNSLPWWTTLKHTPPNVEPPRNKNIELLPTEKRHTQPCWDTRYNYRDSSSPRPPCFILDLTKCRNSV